MNRASVFRRLAVPCLVLAIAPAMLGAEAKPSTNGNLVFNPETYTVQQSTLNGRTIRYRAYEGIVYVQNPVDTRYQTLNIFVPVEYFESKTIGPFNAQTAPIFLPNTVGGYMPGPAGWPGPGFDGKPNAALVALSRGLVVAAPGARGRTLTDAQGRYTGKAPAAIVDLKAAVRYLRANVGRFPGDTERIISNGTSAGGALSALLGATGNAPAYAPYLKALGAAEARDDVFAVSAYCPITNLNHADAAYEWLFSGFNEYQGMRFPPTGGGPVPPPGAQGPMDPSRLPPPTQRTMDAAQIAHAAALRKLFPAYLNGLGLKASNGRRLTLNPRGEGSFKSWIKSLIMASAQKALDAGGDLSAFPYLKVIDHKVVGLDFPGYLKAVGRMKATSAFDGLDLGTGENSLFGNETINARHFTAYGQRHGTKGGKPAEAELIRLMNPMDFIGKPGAKVATHWRIRHGTADRDTSLAVPAILAAALAQHGQEVDFALPWNRGHGGDYDLDELFTWVERNCR
ncbi:MAG: alpha/beta hydrolase [Holophagaceae bacterium]|nr:alpha/beta hydrolase [Holophagaceae bacterium]